MGPIAKYPRAFSIGLCAAFIVAPALACAAAPLLYRQAAYESPVRGDPDDLLLIPGYGFAADDQVVYQAIESGAAQLSHPKSLPLQSSAALGIAEVVSAANIPYSLTVRLPKILRAKRTYALWVVTSKQEWSEPVRINDARPLWVTPAFVYASAALGSLPRYLKVVGRNLEPSDEASTEVRLSGPENIVLRAERAQAGWEALDHYVARVELPAKLSPGAYHIQVKRDNGPWVDLARQILEVRADPLPAREFPVSATAFGGCRPDDGSDAVSCVLRAIAAATTAGGGSVVFGPGTWHLSGRATPRQNGIVVPRGVNLLGAGKLATIIVEDADAPPPPARATFTLLGKNIVKGITFRDAHVYTAGNVTSASLKLGLTRSEGIPESTVAPPAAVEDVIITQNIFDKPHVAISDGGERIVRLFVTDNEFGAYRVAIELAGNRPLINEKFDVEDSVIAFNLFKPGSYLATDIFEGTMASEIGASQRLDFSNNTADGTASDRLYSTNDAHGWRAAFFWHMDNNHEMSLLSQNIATCTGDKDGDGEAFSFDDNANTFAVAHAETVLSAGPGSVTLGEPLAARQNDREIRIPDYYEGHWIQVVEGRGLGQVRKIRAYLQDPKTGYVTIEVAPNWDVIPAPGQTRIGIGREYWQVYTVANLVDQRKPLCLKSNRTRSKGGVIGLWAQTADSAVEGNRQFDTDGIVFRQHYNAEERFCAECNREVSYVDFLEIRGNVVDGEYDWADDCSSSGIWGSLAAGPTTRSPPPTATYGLSISHNTISRADGWRGGAISFTPTWYEGPAPHRWPLVNNALIFHNTLLGLDASPARACKGDKWHTRTGISLDISPGGSELVERTVLYANSCPGARVPVKSGDRDLVRVCPANAEASCECSP